MTRPLISIVLPTYNGSRYLRESIESCLAQTYANWELIIVDDASTDDTPFLIKRYVSLDNRIKAIRNAWNRQLPGSLNIGFAAAKGSYFTWTSDDNCYRPQALNEMIAYLEANPKIDIVYTDFTIIDVKGEPRERVSVAEPDTLVVRNCVGASFLYRRAVHEKLGGYDESLFLVEDYDFWLRALCNFRISPLHQDLYLFREHTSSLTSSRAAEIRVAKALAKEKSLLAIKTGNPLLGARTHLSLIDQALVSGQLTRARRHAFAALRCSPIFTLRHGYKELSAAICGPRLHTWFGSIYRLLSHKASADANI